MDPAKVQELLQSKQREMAFQMDQYYRQRMATMIGDQKKEHGLEIQRYVTERDSALHQLEEGLQTWEKDRTSLHNEAEQGYQELYSTIQSKHGGVIQTLKEELTKAREENAELRQQYVFCFSLSLSLSSFFFLLFRRLVCHVVLTT